MTLDDKLKEIAERLWLLPDWTDDDPNEMVDYQNREVNKAIAEIQQAFADEGKHIAMTNKPEQELREDEKLVIFGWIVTRLGIPKKSKLADYNQLTDDIYDMYHNHRTKTIDELLSKLPEEKETYTTPKEKVLSAEEADLHYRGFNQAIAEVKQIIEGMK